MSFLICLPFQWKSQGGLNNYLECKMNKLQLKKYISPFLGLFLIALGAFQLAVAANPVPVNLGTAAPFAILSKAGVTTSPPSIITGNIGVSPIASTAITGLALTLDSSGMFSTSTQVTGKIYAANYASPTPANLTTAIGDMGTAYTDAAGRVSPDFTELYAGDLSGRTLAPGLYKWSTDVLINSTVTLAGPADRIWIFQISGDLTMGSGAQVVLSGGALAGNVFWQVAGGAIIGTTAHVEGTVLSATAVTLKSGASVNGRLLAQTNVTLINNTLVNVFSLTVSNANVTYGTVSSNVGGIVCNSTCSASFASGSSVTLTAIPVNGYQFTGWGGACSGYGNSCTVTMNAAQTVTANFAVFKVQPVWKRVIKSIIQGGV